MFRLLFVGEYDAEVEPQRKSMSASILEIFMANNVTYMPLIITRKVYFVMSSENLTVLLSDSSNDTFGFHPYSASFVPSSAYLQS